MDDEGGCVRMSGFMDLDSSLGVKGFGGGNVWIMKRC